MQLQLKDVASVVPWLLTTITIAVGIWQYADKRAQSNREPFLQRQLQLAFEASETAAKLATETDPVVWEAARKTFWRLYWGPLGIVEDRGVEGVMIALGQLVPTQPVEPDQVPMRALQQPSLKLAHAARDLILASWRVDLPPLQGHR